MKHKPLDPATLRSVARELRQSERNMRSWARSAARRRDYASAAFDECRALELGMWASHFEGRARLVEGK